MPRRPLLIFALLWVSLVAPIQAEAAEPGAGTVGPDKPKLTWQGRTFPIGATYSPGYCPPERDPAGLLCDHFNIEVDVNATHWRSRDGGLRITIAWDDPADEFNLHVFRDGMLVGSSTITGAGIDQFQLHEASGPYEIRVTPVKVTNSGYRGTAEFISHRPRRNNSLRQAYHGVRVSGANPDREPRSRSAGYDGPPLVLQAVDVGRDAGEPTIGIDPEGVAFYAASADDCPVPNPISMRRFLTSCPRDRLFRSHDGGLSWVDVSPRTAIGDLDLHPTTFDPYVYVEDRTGRVFFLDLLVGGSELSVSDDQGETYLTSLAWAPGENDRQSITSGPAPDGFPLPPFDPDFDEIVYYCVNQLIDSGCARSLDGGKTFLPTTPIPAINPDNAGGCGGITGDVQTDPDGRVFVPRDFCVPAAPGPAGVVIYRFLPVLFISEDAGTSWERSYVSESIEAASPVTQVAADAAGNLYFVWFDEKHSLPYLATSTDHGRTWTDPLMIAPPGVHETALPTVVAGDRGRVAVTFIGTASADATDLTRPWNSYVVVSSNALSKNPLLISSTVNPPSDPVYRGDCHFPPCGNMRDFLDIQVSPFDGSIWATGVDACTAVLDCNRKRQPGVDEETGDLGVAQDGRGLAVRQLSGPWLVRRR